MVTDNLQAVLANIRSVATRVGRDPNDIILIGVTKFATVEAVNEAVRAGLTNVAENKVQLAAEKFSKIDTAGKRVTKHMIGHLQTNKAKDAVQLFDMIQSVDSSKLADEINKRAAADGKIMDILVQVDIAREEQKFGVPEEELGVLLEHLKDLANVRTQGLMVMAPFTEDRALIRSIFRRGREIFERLKSERAASPNLAMRYLSMGMTQDYEIAIEEGANMVRIGTAIFNSVE
jgi:pyridoxal phosphate enzyme (YggS family)